MSDAAAVSRRRLLVQLAGLAGALCLGRAGRAATRSATAPEPPAAGGTVDAFAAALSREIGRAAIEATDRIAFTIPAVAEDGAVVPVTLESRIDGTDRLVLFAERNPFPLLAAFRFAPAASPFVTLRVKLHATGRVVALARANGRYYRTQATVRVVVGGCSGPLSP